MKKVVSLDYDKSTFFQLGDSMCYDSGYQALYAQVFDGSDEYHVYIMAQGNVKVMWRGDMYKCASQMPEELHDKFVDGTAYDELDDLIENNWWELLVYKNGVFYDGEVLGFEPKDFKDEQAIEDYILEVIF